MWLCLGMLALAACGGGTANGPPPTTPGGTTAGCYPDDGASSSQRATNCFTSDSPVDAIVAAGVAATTTAVAGCTMQGCLPPYRCNPQSKLCELIRCDENSACPDPYVCDLEAKTCK